MTAASSAQPAAQAAMTLDDIRRLAREEMPPLSAQIAPSGAAALGLYAPLRQWLADVQGKAQPVLRHPRIALFLSRHGTAPDMQTDIHLLPAALGKPAHPLAAVAAEMNADLQVYELDLARASGDPAAGAAMEADEALQAIAYGMMAVQPGIDSLVIALPNPAAQIAAAPMRTALAQGKDALDTLTAFGGFDMAAALGAALAARLAKTPVLLDDSAAVIADLLAALAPNAALHLRHAADVLAGDMRPAPAIRAALALGLLRGIARAA